MSRPRALFAGESGVTHSIHHKGADSISTTAYYESGRSLISALAGAGWDVTYQPNHVAAESFPSTVEALSAWDVVILSDIGSNTLLLPADNVVRGLPTPDRLVALRDYVAQGGGLIMVGGWLTFQGAEAKANYAGTAAEEALPVTLSRFDDRVECPAGAKAKVLQPHPIVDGLEREWPVLLGYNRVTPRPQARVIVGVGDDPLVVAGHFGDGRSIAFTSDCAPHWAPQSFLDWDGYAPLWSRMAGWAAGRL